MVDFMEDDVIIGEPAEGDDGASSKAISMLHVKLDEERNAREKLENELAELNPRLKVQTMQIAQKL